MIIRNTPANRKLANQMRDIVEAETGFRAHIDSKWNCGQDIRFEICTVGDAPLIVSTCVHEDGRFEILTRLQPAKLDDYGTWQMACRLESVYSMRNRIGVLTAQAKPELSQVEFHYDESDN